MAGLPGQISNRSPSSRSSLLLRRLLEELLVLAVPLGLEAVDGDEAHRRRVHAVAQAGRPRAVGEDVAEVGVAVLAAHLGARHPQLLVGLLDDVVLLERLPEGGPAGAGVVLLARGEERLARHHVDVDALLLVVPVLVAERRLRPLVLSDVVLHPRELRAKLLVAGLLEHPPLLSRRGGTVGRRRSLLSRFTCRRRLRLRPAARRRHPDGRER